MTVTELMVDLMEFGARAGLTASIDRAQVFDAIRTPVDEMDFASDLLSELRQDEGLMATATDALKSAWTLYIRSPGASVQMKHAALALACLAYEAKPSKQSLQMKLAANAMHDLAQARRLRQASKREAT